MRIIDVMLCFPFYVLALSVMAFLGNSLAHLIMIIAFFTFAPSARLIRMEVLAIKDREFIQICRINGETGTSADTLLVHDINFSIGEGQTLAIAGESGSGKTLTALAIMGLLDRSAFAVQGSCSFFPRCAATADQPDQPLDFFTLTEKERKTLCLEEIAMIYQNPFRSLSPVEKIKTHIEHICAIKRRQPDPEWLSTLFDAVQLDRKEMLSKYPHELSGGELQRIMLALAILFKPRLLICDEPTSALDVITQKKLLDDMLPLLSGKTVLFISHDTRVIGYCADETLMLKEQRIALQA